MRAGRRSAGRGLSWTAGATLSHTPHTLWRTGPPRCNGKMTVPAMRMAQMRKTLLIAETDATGRVEWVWQYVEGDRQPVPVSPGRPFAVDPNEVDVHGADRHAVAGWLRARGCLAASVSGVVEPLQRS